MDETLMADLLVNHKAMNRETTIYWRAMKEIKRLQDDKHRLDSQRMIAQAKETAVEREFAAVRLQNEKLQADYEQMRKERNEWQGKWTEEQTDNKNTWEANRNLRNENAALREEVRQLERAVNEGEGVWIHQSDGGNHPESLTCQVLMTADEYRSFCSAKKQLDEAIQLVSERWEQIKEARDRCASLNEQLSESNRYQTKYRQRYDMACKDIDRLSEGLEQITAITAGLREKKE